jgi:hypothetical protein
MKLLYSGEDNPSCSKSLLAFLEHHALEDKPVTNKKTIGRIKTERNILAILIALSFDGV